MIYLIDMYKVLSQQAEVISSRSGHTRSGVSKTSSSEHTPVTPSSEAVSVIELSGAGVSVVAY